MTQTVATVILIITIILWGSWYQFSKKLRGWPVAAFMLWLYFFSALVVWAGVLIIKPFFIAESLGQIIANNPGRCAVALLCGAIFSIGVQMNVIVVKNVGVVVSTSIMATTGVLMGTFISALIGGIREGQSLDKILIGAILLILSTLICQFATISRNKDHGIVKGDKAYAEEARMRHRNTALLLFSTVFLTPNYPLAQSLLVKTDLRADGIPSLLCIAFLATGSFLGTLVFSGIQLSIHHQWKEAFDFKERKDCILMSFISAVCHYGGNLGYAVSAPVLSYAIAWPLSTTYNLVQYLWGLVLGEFNRTSRRTKLLLCVGILLAVAAILIIK